MRERRTHATLEIGAHKKMMNSFVLIRNESDEEKEVWVGRALLLFLCVVGGG